MPSLGFFLRGAPLLSQLTRAASGSANCSIAVWGNPGGGWNGPRPQGAVHELLRWPTKNLLHNTAAAKGYDQRRPDLQVRTALLLVS